MNIGSWLMLVVKDWVKKRFSFKEQVIWPAEYIIIYYGLLINEVNRL